MQNNNAMNKAIIAHILGKVLVIFAALMLLPLAVGLYYNESVLGFAVAAFVTALSGALLCAIPAKQRDLFSREGYAAVGLAWICMGLFGAIPFVISGDIPNYIDAVFETVSGLTTTGSSIVPNVEDMTRAGLFWRLFTHWIGGMGVLVFIMVVMPAGDEHSMHIMRAEVPGPTVGKLVPKARQTARILYIIYAALTVVLTVLLMLGGMDLYDALLHAFATAGTGGFSTKAASVGAYNSAYIEIVIGVFLVIFAANFNLYYLILIGRVREALKSEELHWYIGFIGAATLSIAVSIYKMYGGFATGLRHAFFNVTSIISTAGFGTVDFTLWPTFAQFVLVLLMFSGGCAGGTAGGLKVSRVMLLIKSALADIASTLHPREVHQVRLDGKRVDAGTTKAIYCYFFAYLFILFAAGLIVSLDGYDFTTSFTASLACLSNVGPGLALVGPMGNFAMFSPASKITLIAAMLLGRLEIYPIIILASPLLWRKK